MSWRVLGVVVACAACAAPASIVSDPLRPSSPVVPAASPARSSELGALAEHAEDRFRRRVDLAPVGELRLIRDGAPLAPRRVHGVDPAVTWLVADERGARLRVRSDDQDRLLLWVDRADALVTVTEPAPLAIPGVPAGAVTVMPGARFTLDGASVHFDDQIVAVVGEVAPGVLGEVYEASTDELLEPEAAVTIGTVLRAGPGAGAPVIATFADRAPVTLGDDDGDWIAVEYRTEAISVQGWVPVDCVVDDLGGFGFGLGVMFGDQSGATDRAQIDVDAGACIFVNPGGEPIGVVTAAATRTVVERRGGWWSITSSTAWGAIDVWVHDQARGGSTQRWQRCP